MLPEKAIHENRSRTSDRNVVHRRGKKEKKTTDRSKINTFLALLEI